MDNLEASNEEKSSPIVPYQNVPSVVSQNDELSTIIDYAYKVWSNKDPKNNEAKPLLFSFTVDIDKIREIESFAIKNLEGLSHFPNQVFFDGKVSYKNLSSANYESLDELIDYSSKKESIVTDLVLNWKVFLKDIPLQQAYITINFDTGAEKDIGSLNILHFNVARIDYYVGGYERNWIITVAHDVNIILQGTRLSNLFKPLMIFRNSEVVQTVAYCLGILVYLLSYSYLNYLITRGSNTITSNNIVDAPDIITKFNLYIKYSFSQHSIIEPVMSLGISLALMYIIIGLGYKYLPKLVPRSGILLSDDDKKKDADHSNIVKFIVFGIIFAIFIGVFINILSNYILTLF